MDNYPTSPLTLSELVSQILNDPKASQRERDLAERVERVRTALSTSFNNVGRGDRG